MRKLIYHVATSIDGFIARTNGDVSDFLLTGEHADEFTASLTQYDTVIMGRATYEFGVQFGLKLGEPAYTGIKHIIVSKTLNFKSTPQVHLVSSDIDKIIQALQMEEGKDIWLCGGGILGSYLLKKKLINEICLKINPVILGEGIRLFEHTCNAFNCEHLHSKQYSNGVIRQAYKIIYG